jgi:periodic tryptophan protein 1
MVIILLGTAILADFPIAARAFSNIGGLTYYDYDEKDPYVTLKEVRVYYCVTTFSKTVAHYLQDEDDDEDRQALEVLPTDNLVVTARTEDDISQLEIFVYDESQDHMHPHHDIMLPAKPLCLEWLDYPPAPHSSDEAATVFGNYVAVGTFDPEIEIWSLDTVEQMYPDSVLGRPDKTAQHVPIPAGTGKKKKKKTKHRELDSSYHVDAVLSLSWNRSHRNLLASASADRTVKLWDLSRDPLSKDGGAIRSFNVHKDAVQAVKWNRTDSTVLLTGSYDRTVRMFDTRSPDVAVGAKIGAEVEGLCWDPFDPLSFFVSLENGIILNFDARALPSDFSLPSPSKWTLSAHDGAVSCMDINPHIRGCLITGGTDKQVKVWNIVEEGDDRRISMVTSRDLGIVSASLLIMFDTS